MERPVVLSIAGSDSGGGAGIQADLRVFLALGAFGTTAVTAVTAQNLSGVSDLEGQPPRIVEAQIRQIISGFRVRAVKTGMLWSAQTVSCVARLARELAIPNLVVDPVMAATAGSKLLQDDAVEAYRRELLPLATVMTPNLDEAAILLEERPASADEMEGVAERLSRAYGCSVLLKGGHLPGDPVDLLWHRGKAYRWTHPRVERVVGHGTGCMLSAAIAAALAKGEVLVEACRGAVEFVFRALERPHRLARGVRLAGIENGGDEGRKRGRSVAETGRQLRKGSA